MASAAAAIIAAAEDREADRHGEERTGRDYREAEEFAARNGGVVFPVVGELPLPGFAG